MLQIDNTMRLQNIQRLLSRIWASTWALIGLRPELYQSWACITNGPGETYHNQDLYLMDSWPTVQGVLRTIPSIGIIQRSGPWVGLPTNGLKGAQNWETGTCFNLEYGRPMGWTNSKIAFDCICPPDTRNRHGNKFQWVRNWDARWQPPLE